MKKTESKTFADGWQFLEIKYYLFIAIKYFECKIRCRLSILSAKESQIKRINISSMHFVASKEQAVWIGCLAIFLGKNFFPDFFKIMF